MQKRIFACKLSDDFSGFVYTYGTGKRNRAGALVLGNGRIAHSSTLWVELQTIYSWLNLNTQNNTKTHPPTPQ